MRKQQPWFSIICLLMLAAAMFLSGCSAADNKEIPVTLTFWHVYGDQTNSPLNDMVEEFNKTIGAQRGIKVQVTFVSDTNSIHEAVLRSARKEPGAGDLPDMFISYPKTVLAMPDADILIDFHDYFSEDELSDFIPSFLKEGMIDDRLVVFPIAKSTEIMYINQTLFERFARDTGASVEELETWDGLFSLAKKYYQWTDDQTPDQPGDGKPFFANDFHFNYFQIGVESLGESFFSGDQIQYGTAFMRVWDPYADAAIRGSLWLQNGYSTEPFRTGDVIVSTASSASVLYFEDVVTYADNRTEPITIIAKPMPSFSDGRNMVIQRGAGLCAVQSTPQKEEAIAVFLKWLTEPETNARFATSLGYMPVTKSAFSILPDYLENLQDDKYRSLYDAYLKTRESYTFYTPPQLSNYLELEQSFEKNVRSKLRTAAGAFENDGADIVTLKQQALENLQTSLPHSEGWPS